MEIGRIHQQNIMQFGIPKKSLKKMQIEITKENSMKNNGNWNAKDYFNIN